MKKIFALPTQISLILLILLVFSAPARAQTIVCMETTLGDFCMELLDTEAPVTAQNFLAYVLQGSYRNSFFHLRVNDSSNYVQAGRFANTGSGGLDALQEIFRRPQISNESSVANTRGTVAIVPDDPANPDSATSQFLFNINDNPALDAENGGYTVFARLLGDALSVLDLAASLPVVAFDNDALSLVPVIGQEIPVINSVRVDILDAYVYDGDISDFDTDPVDDTTDEPDTGTDTGGDDSTDTPVPGEGEILYEDAVCVDTNVGEYCMELLPEVAPKTVENFLSYINSGTYDDTFIHRSVPNFVIQGGGYYASPLGSPVQKKAAVQNEFNLSNVRGTVAMARLGGQVNSATSEWYVNLTNNSQLDSVDGGFTVFARIVSGMSVVDAIGALPRANLQNSLGGAFGEIPLSNQDNNGVDSEDLVLVYRIYVTDLIVDETGNDTGGNDGGNDGGDGGDNGSDNAPKTTAIYSTLTASFSLPVRIDGTLYRVFMLQDLQTQGIVFSVLTTQIFSLVDTGQEAATMDLSAGTLHIPSIKVGNKTFTDLEFSLTEFSTLTFKLQSFVRP